MAAMTSFHAEKSCHVVSESAAFTARGARLCTSVRQFLLHSRLHS